MRIQDTQKFLAVNVRLRIFSFFEFNYYKYVLQLS